MVDQVSGRKVLLRAVIIHYRWALVAAHFLNRIHLNSSMGQGYCFEIAITDSLVCHYAMTGDFGQVEETFHIEQGSVYKVGSKNFAEETIAWSEKLEIY